MIKRLSIKHLLLGACAVLGFASAQAVPQTITTAFTGLAGHTPVFPGSGATTPQFTTFIVTNSNPYPIAIRTVGYWHQGIPTANYDANGQSFSLYSSNTSLSGSPVPFTGWTLEKVSPPIVTSSDGYTPVITGVNIIIPPASCGNNSVRFAFVSSDTLTLAFKYATVLSPTAFTVGGVTLNSGDVSNYNGVYPTTAYSHTAPATTGQAPPNNIGFLAFDGYIEFDTGKLIHPQAPSVSATPNPVCKGDSVTLCASGAVSCFGKATYYWFGPSGFIDTGACITVKNLQTATAFTCKYTTPVTDSSDPTTLIVGVSDPKPPVVTGRTAYCINDPFVALNVLGQNLQWYYTPTGGSPIPITPTFNTSTSNSAEYYVQQVVDGCPSPRVKVVFTAAPKPAAPKVTTPIFYCENAAALPLTAIGQNMRWYYDPTGGYPSTIPPIPATGVHGTEDYYVSQEIDGCEGPRSQIDVVTLFKPNGVIVPGRTEICQGDTVHFNYYGSADSAAGFEWGIPTNGGTTVLSNIGETPIIIRFDSAGKQTIDLTVANKGCKSDVFYQPIQVNPTPQAIISAKEDMCIGRTELISLEYFTPTIDTFHWDFDGGYTTHFATDQGPYGVIWPTDGQHVIKLTVVDAGCPHTVYDTLNVHALPDAKIHVDGYSNTSVYCAGDSIRMTANTIVPGAKYEWSPTRFFDTYSDIPVSYARVDLTGYVKLKVTGDYGCVNTDSILINTKPCCELTFPSAFTPNNDGRNDKFRPITQGWHDVKSFRVLNRWGETIFETADERRGWDGTFNGKPQDLGVYFYSIIFKCSGKDVEQKGEVVLVR